MKDGGNFSLFTLYVPSAKLVGKMNALVAHSLWAKMTHYNNVIFLGKINEGGDEKQEINLVWP
jgi:hypothetical protein